MPALGQRTCNDTPLRERKRAKVWAKNERKNIHYFSVMKMLKREGKDIKDEERRRLKKEED